MNISKKRFATYIGIAVILSLILGTVITQAATPTTTYNISGGPYPNSPTYTLWREASNYFSKNEHGQISYSGTNATTVIQNTINAATSGDVLYFKGDKFDDLGSITLKSNITYQGSGWTYTTGIGTVLECANNFAGNLLSLNGTVGTKDYTGYVCIKDLCLSMGPSVASANAIQMQHTIRNEFERLMIRHANQTAIYLDAVEESTIRHCFFHAFGSSGIYLYWSSNIKIEYCEFADPSANSRGILSYASEANTISANSFYFVKHGIEAYGATNLTVIENNNIWQTQRIAIYLHGAYYNTLRGNNIFDCGSDGAYYGIRVEDSNHTNVESNTIINMDSAYQTNGILETGTSDFTRIMNCNTHNVVTSGIIVAGASTHVSYSWNKTTWVSTYP